MWALFASLGAVTTQQLLHTTTFVDPLQALSCQITALIAYEITSLIKSRAVDTKESKLYLLWEAYTSKWSIIYILAYTGALLSSQSLLWSPQDLICAAMSLSIALATWLPTTERIEQNVTVMAILIGLCVVALQTYSRLNAVMSICLALLCIGCVHLMRVAQQRVADENEDVLPASRLAALCLTSSLAAITWFRDPLKNHLSTTTILVLAINTISGAASYHIKGHLFAGTNVTLTDSSWTDVLSPLALVGYIISGLNVLGLDPAVRPAQVMIFSLAWGIFLLIEEPYIPPVIQLWPAMWTKYRKVLACVEAPDLLSDADSSKQSFGDRLFSYAHIASVALGCMMWLPVLAVLVLQASDGMTLFHVDPKPHRALDIVVSYYHEPVNEVVAALKPTLDLETIAQLHPRILVYYKGDPKLHEGVMEQFNTSWQTQAQVESFILPNVGREGETFIRHMLTNWDDLAAHTLFTQGRVQDPDYARDIMRDKFNGSSGFLSLCPLEFFCPDCGECSDPWGWTDESDALKFIYASTYDGRPCGNLTLSYRGEFVASATRIRATNRTLLEDLARKLDDPYSKVHAPEYIQGQSVAEDDLMSKPLFGYTLERMWATIMRCSWMAPEANGTGNDAVNDQDEIFSDHQCLDA